VVLANQDDRYFYAGGFISLSLFVVILALFSYVVLHKKDNNVFAMKKDNYISVSLNAVPVKPSKNDAKPDPKPTPVEPPKAEPEPEVAEATPEPVNTDVSSLFDDVWTQSADTKVVKKVEKVDAKRLAAIEKRIVTKKSQKSQKASESIKALSLVKPSIEVVGASASTAPEVNEYLAKIHALVKSKFYPPASTEGESAKVRVKFDAYGKLTGYRVLVYSRSTMFNEEVDHLQKRLARMKFPENPDKKSISLEIILTVEER